MTQNLRMLYHVDIVVIQRGLSFCTSLRRLGCNYLSAHAERNTIIILQCLTQSSQNLLHNEHNICNYQT
jgi:hypothetical protein